MQKLAQSWLVLQISGNPFLLGLDAFLGEIPIFMFSLIGGVVADRQSRKRMLVMSQVVLMSCAFLLAALFALGIVQVWHILCLSFIVGLAQAFGGPAYQALIPTLIDPEDLPNAIALNSIQFNLARVIGPMLGGLALTQLGAAWCFSLNGVSFIAVIISLIILKPRYTPPPSHEPIMHSLKQGIRFIRSRTAMESKPAVTAAFRSCHAVDPLAATGFRPIRYDDYVQDFRRITMDPEVIGWKAVRSRHACNSRHDRRSACSGADDRAVARRFPLPGRSGYSGGARLCRPSGARP